MSAFGNTEVPAEILEHILDYLHDDGAALRASALVQRSWVATTRLHLYNEEIVSQGHTPRREPMDNATTFIEMCRSPLCTVLGFIQSAIIMIKDPTLDEAVIDVLNEAPGLKKVVYFDNREESRSTKSLHRKLPQVEELVYSPQRSFGKETANMISTFTNLRTLAIYFTDSVRPEYPVNSDALPNSFSNLRHLRLLLSNPEEMFQWLLSSSPSIQLERLELRMLSPYHRGWGSVKHLNAFLIAQADTLKHLSLSVEYKGTIQASFTPSDDGDAIVDLGPLIALSILKFRTHDLRSVRASLATLSSCSVQELQVDHMYWGPARRGCDCELEQGVADLGDATESDILSKAHLRAGHWVEFDHRLDRDMLLSTFKERIAHKSVLFYKSEVHDNFQPDTFSALAYRIVKRTPVVWPNRG